MDRFTSLTAFVRVVENGGFSAAVGHLGTFERKLPASSPK